MRLLFLLLLAPLAACSYTTYLSGADEHGGRVNLVTELSQDSAVEKANDHCRQYNLLRPDHRDRPCQQHHDVRLPAGAQITRQGHS